MTRVRSRRTDPLSEFVKPGRRRTDHPLVIGTIVLCLGITTVGTIFQVVAQLSLSSNISHALDRSEARTAETQRIRAALVENMQAQAALLRRVCVNVARTPADLQDCTAPTKGVSGN